MGWDDARIAELKRHVDGGLTAGKIAVAMGITRNAAIGKVQRLGLRLQTPRASKRAMIARLAPRPKLIQRPAAPVKPAKVAAPKVKPEAVAPKRDISAVAALKKWPRERGPHAVHFAKHRQGQCCMPLWAHDATFDEMFCCGEPDGDTPNWCDAHAADCFRPAPTPANRLAGRAARE